MLINWINNVLGGLYILFGTIYRILPNQLSITNRLQLTSISYVDIIYNIIKILAIRLYIICERITLMTTTVYINFILINTSSIIWATYRRSIVRYSIYNSHYNSHSRNIKSRNLIINNRFNLSNFRYNFCFSVPVIAILSSIFYIYNFPVLAESIKYTGSSLELVDFSFAHITFSTITFLLGVLFIILGYYILKCNTYSWPLATLCGFIFIWMGIFFIIFSLCGYIFMSLMMIGVLYGVLLTITGLFITYCAIVYSGFDNSGNLLNRNILLMMAFLTVGVGISLILCSALLI